MADELKISVGAEEVSGLLIRPADAKALYVLAHGAGVGMRHRAMASTAEGLAKRGIATLRYQFPYMEKGAGRPDPPRIAHAAVRAGVAEAARIAPELPLYAGGRSFGGRMTSQAQSIEPLPGVKGLIFLAFPLHPPGQAGIERADHLERVSIPMLFVSGDRDPLAELNLLQSVVADLGKRATLHLIRGGDHGFKVLAASGRTGDEAEADALDAVADWISREIS
jgi:hypothetical protein